jgi:hypothetical protein
MCEGRKNTMRHPAIRAVVIALVLIGGASVAAAPANRTVAQQLVQQAMAKHPEVSGVELSSTPPGKKCVTIASTEAQGIGERCDEDEFTAMKTNKPFVEKEKEEGKEVYDITMPLHDATGRLIGTVGLDFKPEPNQRESDVVELAQKVVHEMEAQIPTKAKLFEPAR